MDKKRRGRPKKSETGFQARILERAKDVVLCHPFEQLGVDMDPSLKKQFKAYCVNKEISMNSVVISLIVQLMEYSGQVR